MNIGEFAALARARSTNMSVKHDEPVPRETVAALCELAQCAPNHKRTWPWQFALADVEGDRDGRVRLGNVIADAMERNGDSPEKVAKQRVKYLRTPATLIVGSAAGDSELRTAENRDAVAAGVQNILLAATAQGLASYWSSCPRGANDATASLCGFDPGTTVVAIIYLGWVADTLLPPARPPVRLRIIR
ncbi:MAG: nitroreductase [Actinobacteria bacterium]|nr:nitroreductase [Actinomycetota bacterium]